MVEKQQKRHSFVKSRQKALAQKRIRRAKRVRMSVKGTGQKPRLSVFRSNKYIYTQLTDDAKGHTLAFAYGKKKDAFEIGRALALEITKRHISKVSYDRGRFAYHGRVKELAQGARKGGLKF